MDTCERCGRSARMVMIADTKMQTREYFDYCAECSKNLCPECMAGGCCGITPAPSGSDADNDSHSRAWGR